jgi:HK97 family phage major capsid protein
MSTSSTSFDGFTCRDELATFIANAAVTGAPFARSLTPLPTTRGSVAFPTAAPDGFDWVAENGPIPAIDLNDGADVVAVAKLAGLIAMSNEFMSDNELPMSELLRKAVADAMGPKLDNGLLFGAGAPAPLGVFAAAPETAPFGDFRTGVITAWGELVDAGADPEQVVAYASGATVAAELARTNDEDTPIHADGAAAMVGPGILMIAVPSLTSGRILVADRSALYLVLRDDFEAEVSGHAGFANDQAIMRIKGRFTVACPTPEKSMRSVPAAS